MAWIQQCAIGHINGVSVVLLPQDLVQETSLSSYSSQKLVEKEFVQAEVQVGYIMFDLAQLATVVFSFRFHLLKRSIACK